MFLMDPTAPEPAYLHRLPDGTVKQRNPFTGTEVWTVAGRAHRPMALPTPQPYPLGDNDRSEFCPFCSGRRLETPPEKSRILVDGTLQRRMPAEHVATHDAEFRRIPNLFEILSFDYWRDNYGYSMPPSTREWRDDYLATPTGAQHVSRVVGAKLRASGWGDAALAALSGEELQEHSASFFAGGHDVIVARRHFTDDAQYTTQLASAGTLTPDEHANYIRFTVDAQQDLYDSNPYVRYVSVFQNWLKPAGSSLDHLHKQLVSIDERGPRHELGLPLLRHNPNVFNERAVNYAMYHNLLVAENDHAVAFAGFGHRYPTVEVWSKSEDSSPWRQTDDELRGMSDLLHAMHAASGPEVPTNEEWHTRPADVREAMPWRIMLKWRVSTVAGFEGGTQIYLNTIDPWALRNRITERLFELRNAGRIAPLRIATEVDATPNMLRYCR